MSLDCVWILPNNVEPPESFKFLNIKRSFYYANNILAFKGDTYSEWLELKLGYTLYEELKKKEKIIEINNELQKLLKNEFQTFKGETDELSIKEQKDFIFMWNQVSKKEAKLVGWW